MKFCWRQAREKAFLNAIDLTEQEANFREGNTSGFFCSSVFKSLGTMVALGYLLCFIAANFFEKT
jgi:hypothetical protein